MLRASLSKHLPTWALYHAPIAVRAWLSPGIRMAQLVFRDRVLGYVKISSLDPSAPESSWQSGSLHSLHQLSSSEQAGKESSIVFDNLVESNHLRPQPKAMKLAQLEHGSQLDNVMRQQALLKFDGPHLTQELREIDSKTFNSLPDGLSLTFCQRVLFKLRPIFEMFTSFDAASRWGRSVVGRVRDDATRRQALTDYYGSVGMRSEWSHFDSLRSAMVRLVLTPRNPVATSSATKSGPTAESQSNPTSTVDASELTDERNWWLREKVTDSDAVRHAIQLPAVAPRSSIAEGEAAYDIQWQPRNIGLVVFHLDPKFSRLAYMKAPPVVMQRNDIYVVQYLRDALARQGRRLPTGFGPSQLKVHKATTNNAAALSDSATPPPSATDSTSTSASSESKSDVSLATVPLINQEPAQPIAPFAAEAPDSSSSSSSSSVHASEASTSSLRTCTASEALAVLRTGRAAHEIEWRTVTELLGNDHYQAFRLRHVLACFDRYEKRISELKAAQHKITATTA